MGYGYATKCQIETRTSQSLAGQSASVSDSLPFRIASVFDVATPRGLARYAYAMEAALRLISRQEQTLLSQGDKKPRNMLQQLPPERYFTLVFPILPPLCIEYLYL